MKKITVLVLMSFVLLLSGCKKIIDIIKQQPPAEEKCNCKLTMQIAEFYYPWQAQYDTIRYNYNSAGQCISMEYPPKYHGADIPANVYGVFDSLGRIIKLITQTGPGQGFGAGEFSFYRYINDTTAKALYYYWQPGISIGGEAYPEEYKSSDWLDPNRYVIAFFDSQKRPIDSGTVVYDARGNKIIPGVQYSNIIRPEPYLQRFILGRDFSKNYTAEDAVYVKETNDCNYPTLVINPTDVEAKSRRYFYKCD